MRRLITYALLAIAIIAGPSKSNARMLSAGEALKIATNFEMVNPTFKSSANLAVDGDNKLVYCQQLSDEVDYVYVFNMRSGGYVVIGGSDKLTNPVLGYSHEGSFDAVNMPDNLKSWLLSYAEQVQYVESNNDIPSAETTITRATTNIESVQPLLGDINFNQSAPYNNLCPMKAGKRTVSGCVATAVSQLMRYYKHPACGHDSTSYEWNGQVLSMNFAKTPFDWDNILPTYYKNVSYSIEETNAVATLLYAVGVSCEMNYNISSEGGSGAVTSKAISALINYFDYSRSAHVIKHDVTETNLFTQAILDDLHADRPVVFTGRTSNAGHCFIVDGCDTKGYLHVNWGWGGSSNGYFLVTAMNPSSQGIGGSSGGYNLEQQAFVGIQPATDHEDDIEAPGYLCAKSLNTAETDITPGSTATFTLTNIYSYALVTVDYGIGLAVYSEADSDFVYAGLKYTNVNLRPNYGWQSLNMPNCTVPDDLAEGDYRIYAIYTYGSNPNTFETVNISKSATQTPYIKLFVRNGKYYFNEYVEPQKVEFTISNIIIPNDLVTDSSFTITAVVQCSVKQESSLYRSTKLAFINPEDSSIVNASRKSTLRKTYTTGALMLYAITSPSAPGNYKLAVLDANDNILCVSDDNYTLISSGVITNLIEAPAQITAVSGGIRVRCNKASHVVVFNISGTEVKSCMIEGDDVISIPTQGVYIVKITNSSLVQKIIIR